MLPLKRLEILRLTSLVLTCAVYPQRVPPENPEDPEDRLELIVVGIRMIFLRFV